MFDVGAGVPRRLNRIASAAMIGPIRNGRGRRCGHRRIAPCDLGDVPDVGG